MYAVSIKQLHFLYIIVAYTAGIESTPDICQAISLSSLVNRCLYPVTYHGTTIPSVYFTSLEYTLLNKVIFV